ncbi:MAG: energy transducer TonB [Bacteroidetes bacterium]|nr:energy transducer TonB [Bacteroidota bacterium]
MSNGNLADKKGTAVACFNGNYFSFQVQGDDQITFEIETHTRKQYTLAGKLVDQFLNVESKTHRRGFFSVDISHGTEIEVTINYVYVPNGYAVYFASKAWFGGQDASMYIKNTKPTSVDEKKETIEETKQEASIIEEPKHDIYTVVEEMPEFKGGQSALAKYFQTNIQYPANAKESGISGKCFVRFTINPDGNIEEVKILKGVPGCKECDEEAVRLAKAMPQWSPGKQNGKAVYVYYNYPVNFQLK